MKLRTVINIITAQARSLLLVSLLTSLVVPAMARADGGAAEGSVSRTRSVLGAFFPKSQRITYQTVALTAPLKERIAQRLGYVPAADRYTIFIATTAGNIDGYAVIDDERGEHQPITFATKLSARAMVEGVEIVAYRETRGDEVRDPRFRAQFIGKTARDALRMSRDIDAVTGATISSAATAVAVRRAAVLVDELMLGSAVVATTASEHSLKQSAVAH